MAAIRELCGDRLVIGVGVDDCALESFPMGSKFWITGIGDAFPKHNVKLMELAEATVIIGKAIATAQAV